jgi:hypothetical protein
MDRGVFLHVLGERDIAFVTDHVGPDGFAVIGFFVGDTYKNEDPSDATRHQSSDSLFQGYKELALDQSWLESARVRVQAGWGEFTFGFSHDVALAKEAGCGAYRGLTKDGGWDHVCIVTYRGSADGKTTLSSPGYRFSDEHHNKGMRYRPTVAEIKTFIQTKAKKEVENSSGERMEL